MNPRVGRAMTAPSAAFARSPSVDDGTPAGERPEVADVGAGLRRASRSRCGLDRTGHRTGVDDGIVGKNVSLEPARTAYAVSPSNYLVRTPCRPRPSLVQPSSALRSEAFLACRSHLR